MRVVIDHRVGLNDSEIFRIYMAVREWLNNFAFHIGMDWQIFFLPPVFLLTISIATIALISLRAAVMSPVVSLRHE